MTATFLPESFSSAAVIWRQLRGIERLGRHDLGGDAAGLGLDHRVELARDRRQRRQALAVEQQVDEVASSSAATPIALRAARRGPCGGRRGGSPGSRASSASSGESFIAFASERRSAPILSRLLCSRADLEDGLGVAAGEASGDHPFRLRRPTFVMNVADELASDRRA